MRKILVLAGLFTILSVSASAQVWFQGSFDDALARAKAESKLVLIDFYSDG